MLLNGQQSEEEEEKEERGSESLKNEEIKRHKMNLSPTQQRTKGEDEDTAQQAVVVETVDEDVCQLASRHEEEEERK